MKLIERDKTNRDRIGVLEGDSGEEARLESLFEYNAILGEDGSNGAVDRKGVGEVRWWAEGRRYSRKTRKGQETRRGETNLPETGRHQIKKVDRGREQQQPQRR